MQKDNLPWNEDSEFCSLCPCWHSFGLKEGLSTQSRWGENLKILQLEMFSEKYLKKKKKITTLTTKTELAFSMWRPGGKFSKMPLLSYRSAFSNRGKLYSFLIWGLKHSSALVSNMIHKAFSLTLSYRNCCITTDKARYSQVLGIKWLFNSLHH